MGDLGLVLRTLLWYRRSSLAVALGAALAAAVLTGALVVGDSVAGSLAALERRRWGPVTHLLRAPRLFPADLARRLAGREELGDGRVAAGLVLPGSCARGAGGEGPAWGDVQLLALDLPAAAVPPGECILNDALAEALGVKPGERITVRLPALTAAADRVPFARRDGEVRILRPRVGRIAAAPGFLRRFSLHAGQRRVKNCWLNLGEAAAAAGQPGRANLLLGCFPGGRAEPGAALRKVIRLADYGLTLRRRGTVAILESERLHLSAETERAARDLARREGGRALGVTVHLINTLTRVAVPGRPALSAPYLVAAGLEEPPGGPLARGEAALNAWAARDLTARSGDGLRLSFYRRRSGGTLVEEEGGRAFTLARIVPMDGAGADPSLTPELPGLTGAEDMGDWDPPPGLPIDLGRIRPEDEKYWDRWRAAPRLFLSLEEGMRLWGKEFGGLSSLRIGEAGEGFAARLAAAIEPARLGFAFRPVGRPGEGGGPTTDFTGLFLGFSFFLIAAAALLAALLFTLSLEDRLPQSGLLQVLGYAPRRVARMQVGAGAVLALAGGLTGVPGGALYAALMIWGLDTWWSEAVGTGFLTLHLEPATLAWGFLVGTLVALAALGASAFRSARIAPLAALQPGREAARVLRARRRPFAFLPPLLLLAGAAALVLLSRAGALSAEGAFFGAGLGLLAAFVALVRLGLDRVGRLPFTGGGLALLGLALRNAGRHRGRSLLTLGLVGAAVFTITLVACLRRGEGASTHRRESGAGGYTLLAETGLPLPFSPATPAGRKALGIGGEAARFWEQFPLQALRIRPGDGLSCLNLYRPRDPRIASVPAAMRERGGFAFTAVRGERENPWSLLAGGEGEGALPVFADAEAARWNLHKDLGDTITVTDEAGRAVPLRLVGLLRRSIFQGELLMGEENFARLFPSRSGCRLVLVSVPPEMEEEAARRLRRDLADFAPAVESTAARLARFGGVAGTYMAAFQALGSLGLLLGLAGTAVVMLRTLGERRRELALLAVLGHRRAALLAVVVGEQALLTAAGLAVGAAAALVAALPHLGAAGSAADPAGLLLALALLLAGGVAIQWAVAALSLDLRPRLESG